MMIYFFKEARRIQCTPAAAYLVIARLDSGSQAANIMLLEKQSAQW